MPMLILAMRVETEIIFKMNYRVFLGNKGQSLQGGKKKEEQTPEGSPNKEKGKVQYSNDIIQN